MMTCTSVDVVDSKGRANAKQSTKIQYDGLSDAKAVMTSPRTSVRRSTAVRPQRSARDASGMAPSEAKNGQTNAKHRAGESDNVLE